MRIRSVAVLVMALAARLLIPGGSDLAVAGFDPAVTVSSSTFTDDTQDWVGRASVKRRPSDNALVLVYRTGSAHAINDGALHIRFSDDDGATWSNPDTTLDGVAVTGFPMNPTLSAGQDAGEPWLMVAPNGDLLLHMWRVDYNVSLGGSYQSRSTNGGTTWSTPAPIDFTGITGDTSIFSTDDDFVYDRVIYAGARKYTDSAQTDGASILIKSADNGATWEYVSIIRATDAQEFGMEYVGNSTIVASVRDIAHTHAYQYVSTNMGATWSTARDVTSDIGIAGRQRIYTRMHLQGQMGWWKDPRLVMVGFVHQVSGDSQSRRNAVWFSPDRGATWDGPHYLDVTSEDAGYGDLFWDAANARFVAVLNQGTLAAASLKQYNLTLTGLH